MDNHISPEMKLQLIVLPVFFYGYLGAWAASPIEEENEGVWVAGVEAVRLNCGHIPDTLRTLLEEYDSTLVQEYFRHFQPRDTATDMKGAIRDMEWKLMGLAMYGKKTDLEEMKTLESALLSLPTERYGQLIQAVAQAALMAREGSPHEISEAMNVLKSVPQWFLVDGLLMSGGSVARDKLTDIAKNPDITFEDRCEALSALDTLDDPRRLDVVLLSDFIDQLRKRLHAPDDGTVLEALARGKGMAELNNLKSVEALRDLVKQGFKLPRREVKKKTVRGGIDWSKYWKYTSPPSHKVAPMRQPAPQPAPQTSQQPKLEKPDAATPTQKPPANNTGALIAAAAAIVGLLAALIWFLRKK